MNATQHLGALPEPMTSVAPVCQHCKGMRWLRYDVPHGHPKFGKITKCACATGLASNDVPSDVYTWLGDEAGVLPYKTLATYRGATHITHKEALSVAETWLGRALRNEPGLDNLLYKGKPGTGKTHLVAGLINALTDAGIGCLFAVLPSFFESYYPADFERKDTMMSRMQTIPVLALDDLDKVSGTTWQKDELYKLLNARYNAGKPTLLTTNATDSLTTWFNAATISRLYARMQEVALTGADYRLRKDAR
jgi:DNA replication protein DnaC